MYANTEGYGLYKEMDLASRTAAASPLDLVLVLYNGLTQKAISTTVVMSVKPRASTNASTSSMP